MKIKKKYTPIYRDATALLRPKTALNDMTIALDPGNPSAGELPEGGTLPDRQTQPRRQPRRVLRRPRRRHARLPPAARRRRRRGPRTGNAEELAATLKRFDPTGAQPEADQPRARQARQGIRRSIHNFRLLSEALGDSDTQLGAVRRRLQPRLPLVRERAGEPARDAAAAADGAAARPTPRCRSPTAVSEELGPTLGELLPTAEGLAPALKGFQQLATDDDAGLQGPAAPVRAGRRSRRSTRCGRPPSDLAESLPGLTDSLDVLNDALQHDRLQPAGQGGGLPLLARLGQPPRRVDLQRRRTRTARSGAA